MTSALVQRLRDRRQSRRRALRTQTYATAAFNPPTARCEVVPVGGVDGARLRVHAYGPPDGDLVVLVHGWTCSLENWNAQINLLADRYRVIAYDHRGHGESDLGSSRLTTDLLADDLAAVLAATQGPRQRVVLVGHSLGGMTIQAWARRHPDHERVVAALLTNTAADDLIGRTTVVPLFNRGGLRLPRWLGRLALTAPLPVPPFRGARWVFRRQVMSLSATGDAADFCLNIVRSCPLRVRSKFGLLLADLDVEGAIADLAAPVTLVAGEYDDLTPVTQAERIADTVRHTGMLQKLITLPTGHFSHVEAYQDFNAELLEAVGAVLGPEQGRISG